MSNYHYDLETFEKVHSHYQNSDRSPRRKKYKKRIDDAYPILKEKARNRETISYSELAERIGTNRRGYLPDVIGGISRIEHHEGRPLLSVLVVHKGKGTLGEGFYGLLDNLGWLDENGYSRPLSDSEKKEITEKVKEEVYAEWGQ